MSQSSIFPVYIKTQYDGSGGAFDQLTREVARAADEARKTFERSFSGFKSGASNLSVDLPGLRKTAADAEYAAQRVDALRVAAINLSRATGDKTNATVQYIKALSDQSVEADRALRIANAEVTTHERLQAEIEKTITSNAKLAQSYRNTFLEQAKAENAAYRFQQGINAAVAPGLTRKATDNGAGFGALASMVREQEAAKRLQNELDVLRRAEVGAAEGARILEAAHRGTALASDHAAKSARDSAAAFEAAFSARTAAALGAQTKTTEEAAAASRRYATDLELVKRAIDPTRVAQQQLDAELARADAAFEKGAIDARQYGLAVNAAANNFEGMVTGVRRGTDAWGIHANSMRGSRQAMVQTGQQLQDVAISLYGGQRASVVFAQQIPQLAFALTSLEGSANKTADKIGRFATVLSGPFSLLVVAASAVLGGLIDKFLLSGDEADKSGSAMDRLTDKLDLTKNSYEALRDVVKEYSKAQDESTAKTYEAIIAAETEADRLLQLAKAKLANTAVTPGYDVNGNPLDAAVSASITSGALESRIAELEKDLREARTAGGDERSKRSTDERYRIETDFNTKMNDLRQRELKDTKNLIDYEADRVKLINAKKAALDAYDKTQRKVTDNEERAADIAARTINFALPVSGGRITSEFGKRTDPITGKTSFHAGRDYAVPVGTRVRAPAEGVVSEVGRNPSSANGIFVRINHGGGTESTYLHLSKADVVEGQVLTAGEYLGLSGNTGRSTGPHLHEQFKVNNKVVDPSKRGLQVGGINDLATDIVDKQGQAFERAIAATDKYADSASSSISRVTAMWDDQPRLIDRSSASVTEMSKLVEDLTDKLVNDPSLTDDQRGLLGNLLKSAEAAKALAAAATDKPIRDMVQANAENAAIDSLRLQNLSIEAEVLGRTLALAKTKGSVTEREAETIAQIVMDENRRAILLERQNEAQQRSLQTLEATQSNLRTGIRDLLSGKGFAAIGDFFKRQWDIYLDGLASQITDQLFGEAFQQQKLKILGLDKVDEAGQAMGVKVTQVVAELERFRKALGGAANDNPLPGSLEDEFDKVFDVNGKVLKKAASAVGQDMSITLGGLFKDLLGPKLSGKLGSILTSAFSFGSLGGMLGGQTGQLIGSGVGGLAQLLSGGKGAIGSILGSVTKNLPVIGAAIAANQGLNKLFGNDQRVGGNLLHTVLGPILSLFLSAKKGSASVSNGSISISGNNKENKASANNAAGSINAQIAQIAERLGASVGSYAYTIGLRKDEYRVSGSSGGDVTSKNPTGLLYKGKDAEEAARVALLNAIQDGAITGIRAGAQRLLQAGKDLEAQVTKALSFQSIFDRLKAYEDPMGAALDKLDREFENLRKIAIEAGEGLVELEKLYGIERANVIKEANEKITSSLRDLYDSLTVGNDARSLSERRALAQSKYDPLATRVAAGDNAAYDDFSKAAQTLLDIERQIFGSQSGYFSRLDEITSLTKTRIDAESNVASISSDRPGIFTPTVANDNVPVVNSIDAQTNAIVSIGNQTNALLADLLSKWNGTIGMQVAAGNYF